MFGKGVVAEEPGFSNVLEEPFSFKDNDAQKVKGSEDGGGVLEK